MSAADSYEPSHDTPPGLLAGLSGAVLRAIEPFDAEPRLGVPDAAKAAVIAALAARHRTPVLVLSPTPARAAELIDALPLWLCAEDRQRLRQFPARETAPYERQRPGADLIEARLSALESLQSGAPIIIADADAVAQRTLPAVAPPLSVRQGAALAAGRVRARARRQRLRTQPHHRRAGLVRGARRDR